MKGSVIEIIPTCVPKSAEDLAARVRAIRAFSSHIHIDIVDGLFAPLHTWPYTNQGVFGEFDLSGATELVKEVHLMVEEPRAIGIQFARRGAFRILGHIEVFQGSDEAHGALEQWRQNGAREVGLGILMGTPLELLEPLVLSVDVVHMMSIATIGKQGILYDPRAPARVQELHDRYPDLLISVDGGVSEANIPDLVRAGALRFGVGAVLAKSLDPQKTYQTLQALAEEASL